MTDRELMQQALEALEAALSDDQPYIERCKQTITALRAAIEQAQEPVAHTLNCVCGAVWDVSPDGVEEMVHAPTPSPRQWQGLTDEEIENMMDYWSEPARSAYGGAHTANGEYVCIADIIRDAEKRLKEKNT